jgi:hypothetical protein
LLCSGSGPSGSPAELTLAATSGRSNLFSKPDITARKQSGKNEAAALLLAMTGRTVDM